METSGNGLSVADVAALGNGGMNGMGGFEGLIYLAVIASMFGGGNWFGNNSAANTTTDALLAATLANNNTPALGYENLATASEVQRGFDNQNSMANQREILASVNAGTAQSVAAVNQSYHDIVGALGDRYSELQRDIAANAVSLQQVMANQQACCCDTKQLIQATAANTDAKVAESKYDAALGMAGINANIAQNKYEGALSAAGINSNIAQNRYEAALNTASINENVTAQVQKVLDAISQSKIDSLQSKVNLLELQNAVAGVVKYPMNTSYSVPSPCFASGCCCGSI